MSGLGPGLDFGLTGCFDDGFFIGYDLSFCGLLSFFGGAGKRFLHCLKE
jgi:hypothetical protein